MREKVLNSFTKPDSTLRLLIATTAFGMGVDCQDIRTIIHWGFLVILNSMFKKQEGLDVTVCRQKLYFTRAR